MTDWTEVGAIAGVIAAVLSLIGLYIAVLTFRHQREGSAAGALPYSGPYPDAHGHTGEEIFLDIRQIGLGVALEVAGFSMAATAATMTLLTEAWIGLVLLYAGLVILFVGILTMRRALSRMAEPDRDYILQHMADWTGLTIVRRRKK